jgi:hypothetical protein
MSDSSDEESKLTKGIEYRRFSRGDVDITIDVREYAGGKHRAKMLDLSQSGCRVESVTLLREDRHVFITLPGFAPLEAQVVWHHKGEYGCSFVNGLHPAIYDHIIAKYPSLGER